MFCSNCGKEIVGNANFCSNCGSPIEQSCDTQKNYAPNADHEIIIQKGLSNRCKGLFVENGYGMLTNKRFIYSKHHTGEILAIGVFIYLTKGNYDFDIPITNIKNIEDGKHGFSKTIIINTKDGDSYEFYFKNREEWKIAFSNLIK